MISIQCETCKVTLILHDVGLHEEDGYHKKRIVDLPDNWTIEETALITISKQVENIRAKTSHYCSNCAVKL